MKIRHLFTAIIGLMCCILSTPAIGQNTSPQAQTALPGFVTTDGTHFRIDGKPYYFIGANMWYAPILASEGQGGNRQRLQAELDILCMLGVRNLRILAGADSGSPHANTVRPVLQNEDGSLNDTLLAGLDHLLVEMGKRNMKAVIYLTNAWDWSGGYGHYLVRTGHAPSPNASGEGYNDYVEHAAQFIFDDKAQQLYLEHVERIVTRKNTYTGLPYSEDPTIMSWQICNEPRPFSKEGKAKFSAWIGTTATLIKQLDPHHLVSTGSEGLYGCEKDTALCTTLHAHPAIDYLTVHIWPVNWGWARRTHTDTDISKAIHRTEQYIRLHEQMAMSIRKPFVIEEFGYPRDTHSYSIDASTSSRDRLYAAIMQRVVNSHNRRGALAGCNFWGWGGIGRPTANDWQPGMDYLCDPPHEPQGWYSVFDTDKTTLRIIRDAARKVSK